MKSAFFWETSRDEAEKTRSESFFFFFAAQILKGPTDLWDEINGDQTSLNFSFNVTPQDDS